MLDTENEYFESRRAYINAERDHAISTSNTLAGMGRLVQTLVANDQLLPMTEPTDKEGIRPVLSSLCPDDSRLPLDVDKDAIYREALEKQGLAPPETNASTEQPVFPPGNAEENK